MKILKYNNNHSPTDLFGRPINVSLRSNNEQYRKNQKNFFKPRIKINDDLIKSQIPISVELNEGNN